MLYPNFWGLSPWLFPLTPINNPHCHTPTPVRCLATAAVWPHWLHPHLQTGNPHLRRGRNRNSGERSWQLTHDAMQDHGTHGTTCQMHWRTFYGVFSPQFFFLCFLASRARMMISMARVRRWSRQCVRWRNVSSWCCLSHTGSSPCWGGTLSAD